MATVLITGGTGMIGRHLATLLLSRGYEIIVLSRKAPVMNHEPQGVHYAQWDVAEQTIDAAAVAKADYIIHLAGAGVAEKRWTDARKKEIADSRTCSGALLVKALKEIPNNVKAVISASAIGWYGPDTRESREQGFEEEAPADTAFLGNTCRLWEQSILPVEQLGKRLVRYRIGIVLSRDGGALPEFKKPLQFGIATILGNGEQVMSWIHIEDLCRLFLHAIENETMSGVYNAVAPKPVTNKYLVLALAKQMRGNRFIPVHMPAFILKILLGEMSIEVLKSATVSSNKLRSLGFSFTYDTIEKALKEVFSI